MRRNEIIQIGAYCWMTVSKPGFAAVTVFDADVLDTVKKRRWYLDKDGYVFSTDRNAPHLKLHRVSLGAKKGEEVDHKNRDRLDNRRANLRIVTHHENTLNRTRGKGITYDKSRNKWRARLKFKGRDIHLGRFDSEKAAAEARAAAAIHYFGQYA